MTSFTLQRQRRSSHDRQPGDPSRSGRARIGTAVLSTLLILVACNSSTSELEKRVVELEKQVAEVRSEAREEREEVTRKLDELMLRLIEKPAAAATSSDTAAPTTARPTLPATTRPSPPATRRATAKSAPAPKKSNDTGLDQPDWPTTPKSR